MVTSLMATLTLLLPDNGFRLLLTDLARGCCFGVAGRYPATFSKGFHYGLLGARHGFGACRIPGMRRAGALWSQLFPFPTLFTVLISDGLRGA